MNGRLIKFDNEEIKKDKGGIRDMKYFKFLVIPLLFVALAFMNIGGCGGSSGGGGGNGNGNGNQRCQMPALDTDFSNLIFFFIDLFNQVLMGVSSDSELVAIALAPIPFEGDILAVLANPVGANDCVIFGITDLEIIVPATGTCQRQVNGEVFVVNNLSSLGVDFPTLVGDCDESQSLLSSVNDATLDRALDMIEEENRGVEESESAIASQLRSLSEALSE